MKDFKLAQPQTLKQASSLLFEKGQDCLLMAGGTDLLDQLKSDIIAPEIVIDLKSVSGLDYIREDQGEVYIGALTRIVEVARSPLIKNRFPVLQQAALSLATPQLRNVGTVGGNLCQRPRCWYYRDSQVNCRKKGGSRCYAFRGRNKYHAIFGGGLCYIVYPSDLAPALISLDAKVKLSSPAKSRDIPLEDFYVLPQDSVRQENVLRQGEILQAIRIPGRKAGENSTYLKLKERGTWDFAVVSAAVSGAISEGVCRDIRIVLGGVAPIPWRLTTAENKIKGKKITDDVLRQAAREALKEASPLPENSYKKELVEAAVCQAVTALL